MNMNREGSGKVNQTKLVTIHVYLAQKSQKKEIRDGTDRSDLHVHVHVHAMLGSGGIQRSKKACMYAAK